MTAEEKKRKFTIFLEEILKKSYVYPYLGVNAFDKKVDVLVNYGSDDCFIAASPLSKKEYSYHIQIGVLKGLNKALESDGGIEDYRWLKNVFLGCFYHEGAHLLWTYFGILNTTFPEAKRKFCLAGFNILEDLLIETLAIERVERFKLPHEKNFLDEAFQEMRAFYFGGMKYESSALGMDPVEINNPADFLSWVLCYIRGARPPKNKISGRYLPLLEGMLSAFWKEGNNKKRGEIAVDFFALVWEGLSFHESDFYEGLPRSFRGDVKGNRGDAPGQKTPVPLSTAVPGGSEEESEDGDSKEGDAKVHSDESEEESGDEPQDDAKVHSDESEEESGDEPQDDAKAHSDESEEESGDEPQDDAKAHSDESGEDPLLKEISTVEGLCSSLESFTNLDLLLYGSETVHPLVDVNPLSQDITDKFEVCARKARGKVSLYIEEIKDKFQELIMEKKSRMVGGNPFGKLNLDSYMKNPGIANSLKWFDTKRGVDYKQDLAMTLLVDFSGSMVGTRTEMANQSVILLDEVCTFLGVPLQIEYFSTLDPKGRREYCDAFSYASTLITREFDDRAEAKLYPLVSSFFSCCLGEGRFLAYGNSDPFNVAGSLGRLRERKEEKKILVVLSDGHPCYDDVTYVGSYRDTVNGLFKKIVLEEKEILVYGIGIETDAVKEFYPNYFVVEKAEDLVGCVDELIKKILFV